jgi:hypothetical protein
VHEHGAGGSGDRRTEHEHRDPPLQHRHTERGRDEMLVASGDRLSLHRTARQEDGDHHHDRERDEPHPEDAVVVERRDREPEERDRSDARGRVARRTGEVRPPPEDLEDDLGETERRDREVELGGAPHEEREARRDHACDDDACDEPGPERVRPEYLDPRRPRRRVPADGGERGLREGELAGHTEDEIEPDDDHRIEEPGVDEVGVAEAEVAVLTEKRDGDEEDRERDVGSTAHRRRSRPSRRRSRRGGDLLELVERRDLDVAHLRAAGSRRARTAPGGGAR